MARRCRQSRRRGGRHRGCGRAALAALLWRAPGNPPAADAERPLLAVRPFRSLSPAPQQGYFADGMTEEIRGQLSQIAALRLLSRNGRLAETESSA
jgi:TolB-like protein